MRLTTPSPIQIVGDGTAILTIQGNQQLHSVTIDEASVPLVKDRRWCLGPRKSVRAGVDGDTIYLTRHLLGITDPRLKVHTRNRDTFDLRLCNLIVGRSGKLPKDST